MIIKTILAQLATADKPVVKVIRSTEHFKIIVIGLKQGMVLKAHKTLLPTRLMVSEGAVVYRENEKSVSVDKHEDIEIPVHILHSLEAREDSLCYLIQG